MAMEPEPAVPHRRFTRFMPEPRGRTGPVVGLASDPVVVKSLALSGRGWLSRDGRVLTAGSLRDDAPLATLPETSAAVEAFGKAVARFDDLREKGMAEIRAGGRPPGSLYATDCPEPWLHDFLNEAGWIEVDLVRDEGVKKAFCGGCLLEESVTAYRDALITLGEGLGCRVYHGVPDAFANLLFDPTDNDGLGYRETTPPEGRRLPRDTDEWDLPVWEARLAEDDEDDLRYPRGI